MDYKKVVNLVREITPPLSLKSTNRDLARAIRNVGINVYYSDMSHLPKDNGFIYGFVHTGQKSVNIIVNATMCSEQRRYTKAKLLGYTMLYLKWLPTRPIREKELFVISSKNINTEIDFNLSAFADEFLAPKKNVQEDYVSLTGEPEEKIKLLSYKYGVSECLIATQLFDWGKEINRN